MVKKFLDE
jgi:hypothetical protein